MKGVFGGAMDVIGWGSVLFVLLSGFWTVADQQGGVVSIVNQTIENPQVRDSIAKMQMVAFFLTPLVDFNVLGQQVFFSIDAFTILVVLAISMVLVYVIAYMFRPSMFYVIPIFIITFIVAATLWQGFWLDSYMDAGQEIGVDRAALMENLRNSGQLLDNQILLMLNILSFAFVIYKFYGILPGV